MINLNTNKKNIVEDIKKYWKVQSERYSNMNIEDMEGNKREVWEKLILENVPQKEKLKILDVGTGPGFFSIIMALKNHDVTGIDITPEMIEQAKNNALYYEANVDFRLVKDNELPFDECEFDLVICRDVIWNLKEPIPYLKELNRVLKKGGRIIYFDANWYLYLYDKDCREKFDMARKKLKEYGYDDFYGSKKAKYMEKIAYSLPLSKEKRPKWDKENLTLCGFKVVKVDEDISSIIWDEKQQIQYQSAPEFMIVAEK